MVVFRDDRGAKMPLFDSQVHCEQEGEGVSGGRRGVSGMRREGGEEEEGRGREGGGGRGGGR